MPKQIKFVSSGLSTILALAGIFIILYQMMAYDYFKLETSDITTNVGLYSTRISSGILDTFTKNNILLGCNTTLPDSSFTNCQTLHILYPFQILALALLAITFVPQLQSAGFITGIVCVIIGVYVLIQFGKIKDSLCEDGICEDGDTPGFSYYLNFGLIGVGALLVLTTMNSFNIFNTRKGKRYSNPYASFYNY